MVDVECGLGCFEWVLDFVVFVEVVMLLMVEWVEMVIVVFGV